MDAPTYAGIKDVKNETKKLTDLAVLNAASEHDGGRDLIVPHHLPESVGCQLCWAYVRQCRK